MTETKEQEELNQKIFEIMESPTKYFDFGDKWTFENLYCYLEKCQEPVLEDALKECCRMAKDHINFVFNKSHADFKNLFNGDGSVKIKTEVPYGTFSIDWLIEDGKKRQLEIVLDDIKKCGPHIFNIMLATMTDQKEMLDCDKWFKQIKTKAELQQFWGTERYYTHTSGLRYTDGVNYLIESVNCQWLIDMIVELQTECLEYSSLAHYQFWTLKKDEQKNWILKCDIDIGNNAFTKKIETCDFPLDEICVNVSDKVMYLPSEY